MNKLIKLKKLVAVATTACFLLTGVCREAVIGAVQTANEATQVKQIKNSLEEFVIPYTMGRITDSKYYGSDRVVINIQDLHCHAEVQKNISKILSLLNKKFKISTIYLEGASGEVDTSWLGLIEDKKLKSGLVNSLLEHGKLTGVEYYSIQNPDSCPIKGLEDRKLHSENIVRLDQIMSSRDEMNTIISEMNDEWKPLKEAYFNSKHIKFERTISKYKDGKINTKKYYKLLERYAKKTGIDITAYRNIYGFMQLMDMEKKLNYKRITEQMPEFINTLKSQLPYNVYSALLKQTDNFSHLDELYVYLTKIYEANVGVQFIEPDSNKSFINVFSRNGRDKSRPYKELDVFFNYMAKSQKINPINLINEEEKLVREINARLCESEGEQEISFVLDYIKHLKDYCNNKISADDYSYFTANNPRFKDLLSKYYKDETFEELTPFCQTLDEYYKVNLERNETFFKKMSMLSFPNAPIGNPEVNSYKNPTKNTTTTSKTSGYPIKPLGYDNQTNNPNNLPALISSMNNSVQGNDKDIDGNDVNASTRHPAPGTSHAVTEIIVVVTGGFHTTGVADLLQKNGISYLVITPNVTKDTKFSESIYNNLINEQAKFALQTLAADVLFDNVAGSKALMTIVLQEIMNNISHAKAIDTAKIQGDIKAVKDAYIEKHQEAQNEDLELGYETEKTKDGYKFTIRFRNKNIADKDTTDKKDTDRSITFIYNPDLPEGKQLKRIEDVNKEQINREGKYYVLASIVAAALLVVRLMTSPESHEQTLMGLSGFPAVLMLTSIVLDKATNITSIIGNIIKHILQFLGLRPISPYNDDFGGHDYTPGPMMFVRLFVVLMMAISNTLSPNKNEVSNRLFYTVLEEENKTKEEDQNIAAIIKTWNLDDANSAALRLSDKDEKTRNLAFGAFYNMIKEKDGKKHIASPYNIYGMRQMLENSPSENKTKAEALAYLIKRMGVNNITPAMLDDIIAIYFEKAHSIVKTDINAKLLEPYLDPFAKELTEQDLLTLHLALDKLEGFNPINALALIKNNPKLANYYRMGAVAKLLDDGNINIQGNAFKAFREMAIIMEQRGSHKNADDNAKKFERKIIRKGLLKYIKEDYNPADALYDIINNSGQYPITYITPAIIDALRTRYFNKMRPAVANEMKYSIIKSAGAINNLTYSYVDNCNTKLARGDAKRLPVEERRKLEINVLKDNLEKLKEMGDGSYSYKLIDEKVAQLQECMKDAMQSRGTYRVDKQQAMELQDDSERVCQLAAKNIYRLISIKPQPKESIIGKIDQNKDIVNQFADKVESSQNITDSERDYLYNYKHGLLKEHEYLIKSMKSIYSVYDALSMESVPTKAFIDLIKEGRAIVLKQRMIDKLLEMNNLDSPDMLSNDVIEYWLEESFWNDLSISDVVGWFGRLENDNINFEGSKEDFINEKAAELIEKNKEKGEIDLEDIKAQLKNQLFPEGSNIAEKMTNQLKEGKIKLIDEMIEDDTLGEILLDAHRATALPFEPIIADIENSIDELAPPSKLSKALKRYVKPVVIIILGVMAASAIFSIVVSAADDGHHDGDAVVDYSLDDQGQITNPVTEAFQQAHSGGAVDLTGQNALGYQKEVKDLVSSEKQSKADLSAAEKNLEQKELRQTQDRQGHPNADTSTGPKEGKNLQHQVQQPIREKPDTAPEKIKPQQKTLQPAESPEHNPPASGTSNQIPEGSVPLVPVKDIPSDKNIDEGENANQAANNSTDDEKPLPGSRDDINGQIHEIFTGVKLNNTHPEKAFLEDVPNGVYSIGWQNPNYHSNESAVISFTINGKEYTAQGLRGLIEVNVTNSELNGWTDTPGADLLITDANIVFQQEAKKDVWTNPLVKQKPLAPVDLSAGPVPLSKLGTLLGANQSPDTFDEHVKQITDSMVKNITIMPVDEKVKIALALPDNTSAKNATVGVYKIVNAEKKDISFEINGKTFNMTSKQGEIIVKVNTSAKDLVFNSTKGEIQVNASNDLMFNAINGKLQVFNIGKEAAIKNVLLFGDIISPDNGTVKISEKIGDEKHNVKRNYTLVNVDGVNLTGMLGGKPFMMRAGELVRQISVDVDASKPVNITALGGRVGVIAVGATTEKNEQAYIDSMTPGQRTMYLIIKARGDVRTVIDGYNDWINELKLDIKNHPNADNTYIGKKEKQIAQYEEAIKIIEEQGIENMSFDADIFGNPEEGKVRNPESYDPDIITNTKEEAVDMVMTPEKQHKSVTHEVYKLNLSDFRPAPRANATVKYFGLKHGYSARGDGQMQRWIDRAGMHEGSTDMEPGLRELYKNGQLILGSNRNPAYTAFYEGRDIPVLNKHDADTWLQGKKFADSVHANRTQRLDPGTLDWQYVEDSVTGRDPHEWEYLEEETGQPVLRSPGIGWISAAFDPPISINPEHPTAFYVWARGHGSFVYKINYEYTDGGRITVAKSFITVDSDDWQKFLITPFEGYEGPCNSAVIEGASDGVEWKSDGFGYTLLDERMHNPGYSFKLGYTEGTQETYDITIGGKPFKSKVTDDGKLFPFGDSPDSEPVKIKYGPDGKDQWTWGKTKNSFNIPIFPGGAVKLHIDNYGTSNLKMDLKLKFVNEDLTKEEYVVAEALNQVVPPGGCDVYVPTEVASQVNELVIEKMVDENNGSGEFSFGPDGEYIANYTPETQPNFVTVYKDKIDVSRDENGLAELTPTGEGYWYAGVGDQTKVSVNQTSNDSINQTFIDINHPPINNPLNLTNPTHANFNFTNPHDVPVTIGGELHFFKNQGEDSSQPIPGSHGEITLQPGETGTLYLPLNGTKPEDVGEWVFNYMKNQNTTYVTDEKGVKKPVVTVTDMSVKLDTTHIGFSNGQPIPEEAWIGVQPPVKSGLVQKLGQAAVDIVGGGKVVHAKINFNETAARYGFWGKMDVQYFNLSNKDHPDSFHFNGIDWAGESFAQDIPTYKNGTINVTATPDDGVESFIIRIEDNGKDKDKRFVEKKVDVKPGEIGERNITIKLPPNFKPTIWVISDVKVKDGTKDAKNKGVYIKNDMPITEGPALPSYEVLGEVVGAAAENVPGVETASDITAKLVAPQTEDKKVDHGTFDVVDKKVEPWGKNEKLVNITSDDEGIIIKPYQDRNYNVVNNGQGWTGTGVNNLTGTGPLNMIAINNDSEMVEVTIKLQGDDGKVLKRTFELKANATNELQMDLPKKFKIKNWVAEKIEWSEGKSSKAGEIKFLNRLTRDEEPSAGKITGSAAEDAQQKPAEKKISTSGGGGGSASKNINTGKEESSVDDKSGSSSGSGGGSGSGSGGGSSGNYHSNYELTNSSAKSIDPLPINIREDDANAAVALQIRFKAAANTEGYVVINGYKFLFNSTSPNNKNDYLNVPWLKDRELRISEINITRGKIIIFVDRTNEDGNIELGDNINALLIKHKENDPFIVDVGDQYGVQPQTQKEPVKPVPVDNQTGENDSGAIEKISSGINKAKEAFLNLPGINQFLIDQQILPRPQEYTLGNPFNDTPNATPTSSTNGMSYINPMNNRLTPSAVSANFWSLSVGPLIGAIRRKKSQSQKSKMELMEVNVSKLIAIVKKERESINAAYAISNLISNVKYIKDNFKNSELSDSDIIKKRTLIIRIIRTLMKRQRLGLNNNNGKKNCDEAINEAKKEIQIINTEIRNRGIGVKKNVSKAVNPVSVVIDVSVEAVRNDAQKWLNEKAPEMKGKSEVFIGEHDSNELDIAYLMGLDVMVFSAIKEEDLYEELENGKKVNKFLAWNKEIGEGDNKVDVFMRRQGKGWLQIGLKGKKENIANADVLKNVPLVIAAMLTDPDIKRELKSYGIKNFNNPDIVRIKGLTGEQAYSVGAENNKMWSKSVVIFDAAGIDVEKLNDDEKKVFGRLARDSHIVVGTSDKQVQIINKIFTWLNGKVKIWGVGATPETSAQKAILYSLPYLKTIGEGVTTPVDTQSIAVVDDVNQTKPNPYGDKDIGRGTIVTSFEHIDDILRVGFNGKVDGNLFKNDQPFEAREEILDVMGLAEVKNDTELMARARAFEGEPKEARDKRLYSFITDASKEANNDMIRWYNVNKSWMDKVIGEKSGDERIRCIYVQYNAYEQLAKSFYETKKRLKYAGYKIPKRDIGEGAKFLEFASYEEDLIPAIIYHINKLGVNVICRDLSNYKEGFCITIIDELKSQLDKTILKEPVMINIKVSPQLYENIKNYCKDLNTDNYRFVISNGDLNEGWCEINKVKHDDNGNVIISSLKEQLEEAKKAKPEIRSLPLEVILGGIDAQGRNKLPDETKDILSDIAQVIAGAIQSGISAITPQDVSESAYNKGLNMSLPSDKIGNPEDKDNFLRKLSRTHAIVVEYRNTSNDLREFAISRGKFFSDFNEIMKDEDFKDWQAVTEMVSYWEKQLAFANSNKNLDEAKQINEKFIRFLEGLNRQIVVERNMIENGYLELPFADKEVMIKLLIAADEMLIRDENGKVTGMRGDNFKDVEPSATLLREQAKNATNLLLKSGMSKDYADLMEALGKQLNNADFKNEAIQEAAGWWLKGINELKDKHNDDYKALTIEQITNIEVTFKKLEDMKLPKVTASQESILLKVEKKIKAIENTKTTEEILKAVQEIAGKEMAQFISTRITGKNEIKAETLADLMAIEMIFKDDTYKRILEEKGKETLKSFNTAAQLLMNAAA